VNGRRDPSSASGSRPPSRARPRRGRAGAGRRGRRAPPPAVQARTQQKIAMLNPTALPFLVMMSQVLTSTWVSGELYG
jgi:hypothetical protein